MMLKAWYQELKKIQTVLITRIQRLAACSVTIKFIGQIIINIQSLSVSVVYSTKLWSCARNVPLALRNSFIP